MKNKKVIIVSCLLIAICMIYALPVFAVTEEEVLHQVEAQGKEAVTGNIFIWFLCAVSFLKISQKIDSFLGSLGINVGQTGGSMLAEAMMVMKTISFAKKAGTGSAGGSPSRNASSPSTGFMSGGLVGMVGRKFNQGATRQATGQEGGGIGGQIFNSSLNKGGDYANQIISNIAKGDISKTGTITGEKAVQAFQSYMGYTSSTQNSTSTATSDSPIHTENHTQSADSIHISEQQNNLGTAASPPVDPEFNAQSIPSYTNIEIGGGRITGVETSETHPQGIAFRMCSVDQYVPPEHGNYTTVQSVDGAQWYKQYAAPAVEKTPFMDSGGKIQYHETLVDKLPPMPRRKDKI